MGKFDQLVTIFAINGFLDRISQGLPAATADTLADTRSRPVGRFDVLSNTPAAAPVAPFVLAAFGRLATASGETCGLVAIIVLAVHDVRTPWKQPNVFGNFFEFFCLGVNDDDGILG